MSARSIAYAALVLGSVSCLGCASARVVETSPEGGVVAIPANTNSWPNYHRDKAMALIEQSSPSGYEIVREEEAVSSTIKHTTTHKKTKPAPGIMLSGLEVGSEDAPGREAPPTRIAAVTFPLQERQEHTEQHTQETEVKEWRIHFRRR